MKIIAIVAQKGGAGKTMLCENLAVAATEAGRTVALIDLDSQPTSANWGDRRTAETPAVVSAQAARLKSVLDAAKAQGVNLVVIDTPPRIEAATLEAAKVADLVLAPVRPIINDVETLPALKELLTLAGNPLAFVVVNAAAPQSNAHAEAKNAAEAMGFKTCPVVIYQRAAYGHAPGGGLGVTEFEPNGKAAQEIRELYKFASKQLKV